MKNPFDPTQEEQKFEFFHEMTESINKWMLEKYPQFDNSLIQKLRQVEIIQNQLNQRMNQFNDKVPEIQTQLEQKIIGEINNYLKKERPDIDRSLNLTAKRLEKKDKDSLERDRKIDEKLKTFKVYESLCEDVYRMQDEMKELKKMTESFTKNIKKAFELWLKN